MPPRPSITTSPAPRAPPPNHQHPLHRERPVVSAIRPIVAHPTPVLVPADPAAGYDVDCSSDQGRAHTRNGQRGDKQGQTSLSFDPHSREVPSTDRRCPFYCVLLRSFKAVAKIGAPEPERYSRESSSGLIGECES